ncbi:hypothetical protein SDJN02_05337, partial [Cucurbita argyrosperma subsp. argyrosperma]
MTCEESSSAVGDRVNFGFFFEFLSSCLLWMLLSSAPTVFDELPFRTNVEAFFCSFGRNGMFVSELQNGDSIMTTTSNYLVNNDAMLYHEMVIILVNHHASIQASLIYTTIVSTKPPLIIHNTRRKSKGVHRKRHQDEDKTTREAMTLARAHSSVPNLLIANLRIFAKYLSGKVKDLMVVLSNFRLAKGSRTFKNEERTGATTMRIKNRTNIDQAPTKQEPDQAKSSKNRKIAIMISSGSENGIDIPSFRLTTIT